MTKMKNLVVCPTRGRPVKFVKMLASFYQMSVLSDLAVCVDEDDPSLRDYEKAISAIKMHNFAHQSKSFLHLIINSSGKTITEIINDAATKSFPDYEYYTIVNDDFVYRTDGWDLALISEIRLHGKHGIAYGNDLHCGVNLCTSPMISGDMVRALGWLQLPGLKGLMGDSVWMNLGKKLHCIFYRPDVVIEHEHYFTGKIPPDETYGITNSKERYKHDHAVFRDWVEKQMKRDIENLTKFVFDT